MRIDIKPEPEPHNNDVIIPGHVYQGVHTSDFYLGADYDGQVRLVSLVEGTIYGVASPTFYIDVTHLFSLQEVRK